MRMIGYSSVTLALVAALGCVEVDEEHGERSGAAEALALSWLGDTHQRVGQVWLPPGLQPPAGRALAI